MWNGFFFQQIIQDTDGSNDENMKSSDVKGHSSHSEMSFSREKGGREVRRYFLDGF